MGGWAHRWAARCADFLRTRPAVRDALLWSLPGLALGLAARAWLLWLLPRTMTGADSHSYFVFSASVLFDDHVDFPGKRRWLYPIMLLGLTSSPFDPLVVAALIQKALGLAAIVALGYAIRKSCAGWKVAVPLGTAAFAVLPLGLSTECQTQSVALLAPFVAFAAAGWASWASAAEGPRSRKWWAFFVPMALALLTRPSVWFVVPGLGIAFLATGLWRGLTWPRVGVALAMVPLLKGMGSEATKDAHLMDSVFPILQVDRPAHAEYKAEIADLVRQARASIDHAYLIEGSEAWDFISNPKKQNEHPLWHALGRADIEERSRIYSDLAREAMLAEPHLFAYMALQRIAVMMSLGMPAGFLASPDEDPSDFRENYAGGVTNREPRMKMTARLFGVGRERRMLSPDEAMRRFYPGLLSPARERLRAWLTALSPAFALLQPTDARIRPVCLWEFRPTVFGILVALGVCLAWRRPWRFVAGPWALSVVVFFATAFILVSEIRERHLAPIAPVLIWMAALAVGGCAEAIARFLGRLGREA